MKSNQAQKEIIALKLELNALKQRVLVLENPLMKLRVPETSLTQAQTCEKYRISKYHINELRNSPEFQGLWTKKGRIIIIFPEFIELMLEKYSHYCRR